MKFALFPNYIFTTRLLNEKEADKVSHNNTDLVTRRNSVYDACSRVICFIEGAKKRQQILNMDMRGSPGMLSFYFISDSVLRKFMKLYTCKICTLDIVVFDKFTQYLLNNKCYKFFQNCIQTIMQEFQMTSRVKKQTVLS